MTQTSPDQITSSRDRLIQLDVLRGVAILLVLGRHCAVLPDGAVSLRFLAEPLHRFGWTGVDLFFVLSGFLVGGLIFLEMKATSRFDLRRFYVRRAFKILPLYLFFLAAASASYILWNGGRSWAQWRRLLEALAINLLSLQNYQGTPWVHTWSLAVEEHFYLALPLTLVLLASIGRRDGLPARPRFVGVLAFGLVIACMSARMLIRGEGPMNPYKHLFPTHLRIDGLFFGVFLAYLYHFEPGVMRVATRWRAGMAAAGAALIAPMVFLELETSWFVTTIGFTFLYIGYGLILLSLVLTPISGSFLGRVFAFRLVRAVGLVGVYSYAIYLFHIGLARQPMQRWLGVSNESAQGSRFFPSDLGWLLATIVYMLLAVTAGVIASLLVETPALKLRQRLFPPRQ